MSIYRIFYDVEAFGGLLVLESPGKVFFHFVDIPRSLLLPRHSAFVHSMSILVEIDTIADDNDFSTASPSWSTYSIFDLIPSILQGHPHLISVASSRSQQYMWTAHGSCFAT